MSESAACLFTGSAGQDLGVAISRALDHRVSPSTTERFPDGELTVRLHESVRGCSVFIVQPVSPPVTENLFELLLFVDACRRAAAGRVTAIVPYLGYTRADKRHARREPITASMVAELFRSVGLDHLVTLDLHSEQIEGFYHRPVENLTAVPTLCDALRSRLPAGTVVVSPDTGRVKMAADYAHRLGTSVVVLHKQRGTEGEARIVNVVGDVRDRPCLIVDDMISTGDTIARAITALLEAGARPDIWVSATHGVLVGGVRTRLNHPALRGIFVTDTLPTHHADWPRLEVVSVVPLLATAIRRLAASESVADLFHLSAVAASGLPRDDEGPSVRRER
jgi:ribose-phosphate pyrophosphokinase